MVTVARLVADKLVPTLFSQLKPHLPAMAQTMKVSGHATRAAPHASRSQEMSAEAGPNTDYLVKQLASIVVLKREHVIETVCKSA